MEEEIADLILKFQNGDIRSFEKIVKLSASRVTNTIYQFLSGIPGEADDLAQEVFIKIYLNLHTFRQESNFYTWLYRITVNTVLDFLRKKRKKKILSLDGMEQPEVDSITAEPENTTTGLQRRETNSILHKLIQELPVKYRMVIVLKDMEDLSYKDIAKTINCSIGTVESRLFRARMMLKEKIRHHPYGKDLL